MALNTVKFPYEFIPNPNTGRPLPAGNLYVGIVNTDPTVLANQLQIVARQQDGTEVNIPQPIQTNSGGLPTYNGSPVLLLVDSGEYCIKIENSAGGQEYYVSDASLPITADLIRYGIISVAEALDGQVLTVLAVGIIPNDPTKRAANTAALLAAWNTAGVRGLQIPPNDDVWYFDYFEYPQKVVFLRGTTTLRGNSGAILDITADPITNVCIDTVIGAPQLSRFSGLSGVILDVPLTAIACRVRNGGMMIEQYWVIESDIGLWVIESYGAIYKNIGCSSVTAALRLCDGVNGGFLGSNTFEDLVLNNYAGPTSGPGGTEFGKGIWHDANGAAGTSGTFANKFGTMDCSSCGWGVYIEGTERGNTWGPYYAENNRQKNIEYIAPTGIIVQEGHWSGFYYGGGAYTPSADVFPAYSGEMGVCLIQNGIVTAKTITTPRLFMTNNYEFGNPTCLDWYEEIAFTPIINRDNGGLVAAYSVQIGTAVRIGKLITAYVRIATSSISVAATGGNIIQGLPYLSGTAEGDRSCGVVVRDSALTSQIKGCYFDGSLLYFVDDTGATVNQAWVAGGTIELSISYYAAS